jgi:alkylhydroperoxidase family enzyme
MSRGDVDALRAAGLDDGEILDANQVTAYFAYANRVADGLGIELESWHR